MSLLLLASIDGAPAVVLAVAGVSAADVAVSAADVLSIIVLSDFEYKNYRTIEFRRSVLQLFNYVCAMCMQAESSYSNGL